MIQTDDAATWLAGKSNITGVVATHAAPAARYEEIEEISRGGCGVVVRAYDKRLHCEVALKRILPELAHDAAIRSRFFHEARITARLAHPGIAPIHDVGDQLHDESPFYTMKWLRGQTLAHVIQTHHALTDGRSKSRNLRELLVRFGYVLQTLSYAHQQGIVHRDLKPSNILIAQFGETIVLDWGLAKELHGVTKADSPLPPASDTTSDEQPLDAGRANSLPADQELTRAGAILGTAAYMSPEQAAGQSHLVDCRSDVFSLGVILYEILTGQSPFRCPTEQETLQHILRSEYRPLRQTLAGVPRGLAAICEQALRLAPDQRYADAGEMERDLQAWLAGDSVSAYREPWYGALDRLANKYRALFWCLFVSLLLISVVSLTSTVAVSRAHHNEKQARRSAEVAHAAVAASLTRETIAHQEAVTQLQQARSSIDGWLLGLDSVLALYPGLSPLRQQLFHQAIDYYSVLADQSASSDMMQLEVMRAKIRLADLQLLNGHADEALQNYQQAVQLLHLRPATADDWQTIANLQRAAALLGMSQIELQRSPDKHVSECLDVEIDEALSACAAVPEKSSLFAEACELMARGLQLRSLALRHIDQLDQAELVIKRAITLYEARVLPADPTRSTTQHRQTFLAMLDNLASTHIAARDYAKANDALQRMIHFYDRLLDLDPRRPDWLEARALARARAGWCHTQLIQSNEAVAELEASENDLQSAWQFFKGEHTYHEKLAQIHNALGHSYFVGGDLQQAQHLLERSLTHLPAKPDRLHEPESLARWIETRLYLATIQIRQGLHDQAILHGIEEALAALQSLEQQHVTHTQSHAQYHWLQAQLHTRQGLLDAAEKTLTQAIDWQERRSPNMHTASWHFWLGRLYAQQAIIAGTQNDSGWSDQCLNAAREHWQAAYDANDKRWSAHAAFELFESWLHNSVDHAEHLPTAISMAHAIVEDHPTYPTAWFWLAEWAWHAEDHELAQAVQEKLERLRRRETLEDRLLKALIQATSGTGQPDATADLLTYPVVTGSHAQWLQQRLISLSAPAQHTTQNKVTADH